LALAFGPAFAAGLEPGFWPGFGDGRALAFGFAQPGL
jgi:hypothetical protein